MNVFERLFPPFFFHRLFSFVFYPSPQKKKLSRRQSFTSRITISFCEGYFRTNYHAFDAKNRCDCVHRVSIEHALLVREDGVDFEQKNCS